MNARMRLLAIFSLLAVAFTCEAFEDYHAVGPDVLLLEKDLGRVAYHWYGRSSNETSKDEVAFVTIWAEGITGDYVVNVVIDCESGEAHFGSGVRYRHEIDSPETAKDYVPPEVIDKARAEFCKN